MKRFALIAVVLVAGLANAQTLVLRSNPLGSKSLTIPPQPTLTAFNALNNVNSLNTRNTLTLSAPLRSSNTPLTINGLGTSVYTSTLQGTATMPSTGTVAYPQSFPATSAKVNVPLELSVQPENTSTLEDTKFNQPVAQPTVGDYSCATARPDFSYVPGKLNFQAQSTSDLGQVDMNFWSGLPPGTSRYVPLGEF